ncbi:transcriptional repressor p66-alpha-like [Tachysurus fulvidraco]|uniref:transcriptional repressor p66-alpha-like n=1 Tax=Tachysurus fulvidraco TaxID=1234273 RepID=UPI000F50C5DE|nr:transcriptional repressor p66-alpha-like [Tachysurus fulvidraco]
MLNSKCNVYLEDCNKKKPLQDPTNGFSIIPSWDKEFVCLIGLENVVQFRLDWLDKAVYAASNQPRTRGKPREFRKYPYTCAKCNTDVSCTWKRDVDSSILCDSCSRCHWRKAHWLSRELHCLPTRERPSLWIR